MERDPVCGMSVVPERAAATVEFEGKKYFFCAKSCAAKFEKEAHEKAPFLKFVPFVFTSALSGQRVTRILELILEVCQVMSVPLGKFLD